MSKERNICAGFNNAKGLVGVLHKSMYLDSYKCNNTGKYFEKRKWYSEKEEWFCKRHAPSEVEKRENRSWERLSAKVRRVMEENEKRKRDEESKK